MTFSAYSLLMFLTLTLKENNGQLYQLPNGPFYDNRNVDVNVRQGELVAMERDVQAMQSPCKNKNKEHKDSLWWTLPIPPMELDGQPDNTPQVKQSQPINIDKPQGGGGAETGAIGYSQKELQQKEQEAKYAQQYAQQQVAQKEQATQQKQAVATSTMKVAIATATAAAAVATTAKQAVIPTSAAPAAVQPKDRSKVYQMQQKPAQQQQQTQPTQAASVPQGTHMVISNKESVNPPYASKSLGTGKTQTTGRGLQPTSHIGPKARGMLKDKSTLMENNVANEYSNQPYYNMPLIRPADLANQGFISDKYMAGDIFEDKLFNNNVNMARGDFDNNEAELGGGNFVGNSMGYMDGQMNQPADENEPRLAGPQQTQVDPWAQESADDRDKRNPLEKYRQERNIVIS